MSSGRNTAPVGVQAEITQSQQSETQTDGIQRGKNRRQYPRLRLEMKVRFLLKDGSEHWGDLLDISASGLAIRADTKTMIGDKVVLYTDDLGGFEGSVKRHIDGGFAVELKMSEIKRNKTTAKLEQLINEECSDPKDRRRFPRISPSADAVLHLADGRKIRCRIIDFSIAAIALNILDGEQIPIGETISIGNTEGRVVRHFSNGITIEIPSVSIIESGIRYF